MFILTEKPSVAKEFANALGGFTYQKGFYTNGKDCITHAVGHVLSLYEPEDYDPSFKKWSLENLPIIPQEMKYKANAETKEQLQIIKNCFNKYDSSDFILATDAEREGEFIGALILDYVNFKHYDSARRFWVSSALTKDVIFDGIKNAKPLSDYEKYKKAGYARQHADWLTGINITRTLTVKGNTVLTFGRVQTSLLGAIFARDKNIENFVKEPYNLFQVNLGDFSLYLEHNGDTKLAQRCASLIKAQDIIKPSSKVTITDISSEKKTEHPPKLFNITGLQKYCSQKYKYSPKKTLEIAQSLYETEKCLSYPRTPSTVLGDDNVGLFLEKFDLLSKIYTQEAKDCILENISESNKRVFNSKKLVDHHALIPLKDISSNATEEQINVYKAVLERFFTVLKPSHIYNSIKLKGSIQELILSGSIKMVVEQGWKSETEDDEAEEELAQRCASFSLPKEGDIYTVLSTKLHEKFTQPKKHFTESSLLSLMENPRGEEGSLASLGTPATRAGIIDALLKRGYIEKQKQSLVVSAKGKFLIETVIQIPSLCSFVGLSTTTQWEEKLENNPESFLAEIKEFLNNIFPELKASSQQQWEKESLGICPLCKKGNVQEGQKSWYCNEYKNGCKFTIWKSIAGAKLTESDLKSLLAGRQTKPKKLKNKDGKDFEARLMYNKQEAKINYVFDSRPKSSGKKYDEKSFNVDKFFDNLLKT